MGGPHQKRVRGPTTGHRQGQREMNEAVWALRQAHRTGGKHIDSVGAIPGQSQERK